MSAIFKKEIRTYFTTLTGYIFLGFFVAVMGIYFMINNIGDGSALNVNYIGTLTYSASTFWILIPVLTMRLFAEEAKQRTDQLLFTSPVRVSDIVLGKFFAAGALFLTGVIITCIFPAVLSRYADIGMARTLNALFGYVLMGLALISVGIFISVLTDNQIIAAVVTFAAVFVMFNIDSIVAQMPVSAEASLIFVIILLIIALIIIYNITKSLLAAVILGIAGVLAAALTYYLSYNMGLGLYDGLISKFFKWFSVTSRYENFYAGVFSLADTVYYLSLSFVFLYLTVNVIEKRRWA